MRHRMRHRADQHALPIVVQRHADALLLAQAGAARVRGDHEARGKDLAVRQRHLHAVPLHGQRGHRTARQDRGVGQLLHHVVQRPPEPTIRREATKSLAGAEMHRILRGPVQHLHPAQRRDLVGRDTAPGAERGELIDGAVGERNLAPVIGRVG